MANQNDAHKQLRLIAPHDTRGYASPDSAIGRAYAAAVNGAAKAFEEAMPNAVTRETKIEVDSVNTGFGKMRKHIANQMVQYVIEHGGVVEAWPDPADGLAFTFVNEDGTRDWDAETYRFNYFAESYKSEYDMASPPTKLQYRNPAVFAREKTASGRYGAEVDAAFNRFARNNPIKFGWRLLMIYLVVTLLICPILSTIYLVLLQFVLPNPEAVAESVNGVAKLLLTGVKPLTNRLGELSLPDWLSVPLSMVVTLVVLILFLIPALMIYLPDLLYGLVGSSVIATVIYGVLMIGVGYVGLQCVWSFLGKHFPKANLGEGFKGLHQFLQLFFSPTWGALTAADRETEKDFDKMAEEFHRQWYAYVCQQTQGRAEFRPRRIVSVTVKGMSRDEYREYRAEREAEVAERRREEEAREAQKAALRDEIESRERDIDILMGGSGYTAEEKALRGDVSQSDYADYNYYKEKWIDKKTSDD